VPFVEMGRRGASEVTTVALVILGVAVGGAMVYGIVFLSGTTPAQTTQTSTIYTTSTVYVTSTSSITVYGQSTSLASADVIVVGLSIPAGSAAATLSSATCSDTTPVSPYVAVSNSGTASTDITGVSLTYAGNTYTVTISGCTVGAAGSASATQYIDMNVVPGSALKGVEFVGEVTLSNGSTAAFTGTFS
jgi:hypothetical protein